MKEKMVKKIQELFKKISVNSVGRSAPPGMYEKKMPEEVMDEIMKKR